MHIVDIHNHSLFGVDDGPKQRDESIAMLEHAASQGVREIVLTPHYRYGMFEYNREAVETNFCELKGCLAGRHIDINLYLGCEYHMDSGIAENIRTGRVHTLADTEYVLTEYSHSAEYAYMKSCTHELIAGGYQPVVAHIERCECIAKKPQLAEELSRMGALIQINADSILGIDGRQLEKTCRKLLKSGTADIVASDAHGIRERVNHMAECCAYISKKYGEAYAAQLFEENPGMITAAL